MPDINVKTPFVLSGDDDSMHTFRQGYYKNVAQWIADHWYTKLHVVAEGEAAPDEAAPAETDNAVLIRNHQFAQDQVTRLGVQLEQMRTRAENAEGELARLKADVAASAAREAPPAPEAPVEVSEDDADAPEEVVTDDTENTDELLIAHKGRKWHIMRGEEVVAEFGTRTEAEARRRELRGA